MPPKRFIWDWVAAEAKQFRPELFDEVKQACNRSPCCS